MAKKKMILDLDTGVDDALALAYAISDPDIDLIGVVASYGNNLLEQTAKNSLQLIELLGQNIPVSAGHSHSSTSDHFTVMPVSEQIHGKNGIGDVELPEPKSTVQVESGTDFLIQAAHQYRQDLVVVPTGPLTNLAAALKKDPSISHLIGNVTLMGGALTVEGNVSDVAEANINQDAEAANQVFTSDLPITMVGLDVTLRTLLTKQDTQKWRALGTTAGTVYADLTDFYIDAYYQLNIDRHGCAIHDPLAVGVAIDPTLVTTLALPMKVITAKHNYGRTIGDKKRLNESQANVKVAINVDRKRFVPLFMEYLTNLLANH